MRCSVDVKPILIVDDDPNLRKTLSNILQNKGYASIAIGTGKTALEKVKEASPAVALIDLRLEDISGMEVMRQIKEHSPATECIVVTAHASQTSAIEAVNLGAYSYVQKPYDIDHLLVTIRRAIEKQEAEQALRESEALYHNLVETSQDLIWRCDVEGRFIFLNPAWEQTHGYTIKEMLGRQFTDFQTPEVAARDIQEFNRHLAGGSVIGYETSYISKSGDEIRLIFNAMPLLDADGNIIGTQGTAYDVTERKRAEEQIKASLREKEVMLKEIHHRVKNNLQVISSLLDLQTESIRDPQIFQMFQDSQRRIHSMALVHEKLYQSQDLARIDFAEYIQSTVDYLLMAYGELARGVVPNIQVDGVLLGIDLAIPCGLIINELVSNALKYAFPEENEKELKGERREIKITFEACEGKYRLKVCDNGIGLPSELDIEQSPSLGLQLVHILAQQLQGTLEIDRSEGVAFKLTFSEPGSGKGVK
jgi:PAS domain S-box-containing protein